MMNRHDNFLLGSISTATLLFSNNAYATVESTLSNFGNALGGRILPLIAILGLCYAAFSFITGNPNAKNHLIYAVIGVGIGLGARSIVDLVRQLVQ